MTRRAAMVVLNHNDADNTARLCGQAAQCPDIIKIIVADNSECRCPAEKLPAKAELFPVSNSGYARGNNAAVERLAAQGIEYEYLIISNPDVIIAPEAITACIDFLESHPGYALAAPHMLKADGTPHPLTGWKEKSYLSDLAYSSGLLSRLIGINREVYPPGHWQGDYSDADCIAGSFFAARYADFRAIGFFDPNTFLYYEEDIIGAKLKRLGLKSAVLNRVCFVHMEGVSVNRSAGLVSRYRMMQRSRLYYRRRYGGTGAAGYALLCAATGLGIVEKSLKAILLRR